MGRAARTRTLLAFGEAAESVHEAVLGEVEVHQLGEVGQLDGQRRDTVGAYVVSRQVEVRQAVRERWHKDLQALAFNPAHHACVKTYGRHRDCVLSTTGVFVRPTLRCVYATVCQQE